MNKTKFLKKLLTCLMTAFTVSALLLVLGNGGNIPWFPPPIVFSLIGIIMAVGLIFPFVWHYREQVDKINSAKVYGLLYSVLRYSIAFSIASFGWKKIFGLQFVVSDEIAAKPMNQQPGEWLTWYYFGHSLIFGLIIALIQISGSFLLLFRRTLLFGATLLFSLMFNLTLINIFYNMNAGALIQSIILTLGIIFLICLDYQRLIDFFFSNTSSLPVIQINDIFLKNLVRWSAIIISMLFTWYLKSLLK